MLKPLGKDTMDGNGIHGMRRSVAAIMSGLWLHGESLRPLQDIFLFRARKKISFDPKVHHEKFKCFWSCGSGWGSFSQESEKNKREKIEILVEFGSLKLKQFTFHLPPSLRGKKIVSLEAFLKNRSLDISFFQETNVIHIKWDNLLSMMAGDTLEIKVLF